MTRVLFALLLLTPSTADAALSGSRSGLWFDVGGGLGAAGRPFTAGVGWSAALGGWVGRYDDDFALGRHWGFGVRLRQDLQLSAGRQLLRSAPMFEVRRGIDLLVVGLHVGLQGGPLWSTPLAGGATTFSGGTALVSGGVTYRFDPRWGVGARLATGIDVLEGQVAPVLRFLVGITYATPL